MKRHDRYLQVAIKAAKEAGRIQKRSYGHAGKVEYKGEIDLVSDVDRLCEKAIVSTITEAFPDHDILSEETPFSGKGSAWKWIIDPIDGTTNYVREYPCFCVSIGLEVEGEMRLGVVYNPLLEELFHAQKGEGAWLNGKRIFVSRTDDLSRSFLCTGFPYDIREHIDFYLRFFREFTIRSLAIRRPGSATLDLCYLAAGRFDGFWELKLHAWDVAAASLMVTESGGRLSDFQGGPFSIYSGETLASNGVLHEKMLEVMEEVKRKNGG
jgi:myo-inositol-1(or 4)-monophosphatase